MSMLPPFPPVAGSREEWKHSCHLLLSSGQATAVPTCSGLGRRPCEWNAPSSLSDEPPCWLGRLTAVAGRASRLRALRLLESVHLARRVLRCTRGERCAASSYGPA